jgi:hypothetical protein
MDKLKMNGNGEVKKWIIFSFTTTQKILHTSYNKRFAHARPNYAAMTQGT